MKQILTIALLLIASITFGQSLSECGLDSSPTLNATESQFLQRYLQPVAGDFDFSNKKVAFVEGTTGKTLSNKRNYFQAVRDIIEGAPISSLVIVLSPEEKAASGGFDAIVTTWSKLFPEGSKKKIIKKLSKL